MIKRSKHIFFFLAIFFCLNVFAHPMPNSLVMMDIKTNNVALELQLPLGQMQLAFGQDLTTNTNTLVARMDNQFKAYLMAHIHPVSPDGKLWKVEVGALSVSGAEQSYTGPYQELTAFIKLIPPEGEGTRKFFLGYDVIIHQVVTHKALVSIRQDWDNGETGEYSNEVATIQLDVRSNTIKPFIVDRKDGSIWRGFKSMVNLGMQHIADGTDHLLFLLVLLLPAPLLYKNKHWGKFGGTKYSLIRLLKVATAFTIGHSITLLAGALGWMRLPNQPVEIMIAISILITAIHAIRPIFLGREIYLAAAFGLVHGLAFASTLANLNLEASRMALSILGFNIGIELMQVFVIVLTVPWLILLSQTTFYKGVRISGAALAGIAALAWITERISFKSNPITNFILKAPQYAPWLLLGLAVTAVICFLVGRTNNYELQITNYEKK